MKKDLKVLNMEDLDLPRGTKIYINQSLCPYYWILWSEAKRLHNIGSINNLYISSRTIKLKLLKIVVQDSFSWYCFVTTNRCIVVSVSYVVFMLDMIFLVLCLKAPYFICLLLCLFAGTRMLKSSRPFPFRTFFSRINFYWMSEFDWSKSQNNLFLLCISLIVILTIVPSII